MDVKRTTAESLVNHLRSSSSSEEAQKDAVCELRLLAKWGDDHRISIAQAGAVPYLLDHLYTPDPKLQENAITALLNLSIYAPNRHVIISSRGALDAITHCLKAGRSLEAKKNAAATIFSLLVVESYRPVVGDRPEVIRALLDLIREGNPRCTKDALKALFHLVLDPVNRPNLVSAGVVPVIFSLLMNSGTGIVEDATAVVAQLAGCGQSKEAFKRIFGIEVLVDLLDTGSPRCQENAASALLNLAQCGGKQVADDILDVQIAMPALSVLLNTGTPRCKSKVSSLLKLLLVHERRPSSAMF